MDALTALGLASNVVQFVQFTADLISTATEIAESARGASQKAIELETVYESLYTLSSKLHTSNDALQLPELLVEQPDSINFNDAIIIRSHIQSIAALSADCRELCGELLKAVQKLQIKGRSLRRFKSFIAALKTVWESQNIEILENRILRYRQSISMHFFPLLWYVGLSYYETDQLISYSLACSSQRCLNHLMQFEKTA
jgi:hypothetical protein